MSRQLLFLCQNLPSPPHGGAWIRSYHTLRLLASEFAVTGIFFYRPSVRKTQASLDTAKDDLSRFCDVHVFPIPQENRRLRFAADHARSVVTRTSYTRWIYDSSEAHETVRRLVAEKEFSLVHLDSLDLSAFLEDLPQVPWVCAHHNVESELLRRRSLAERGARRSYMKFQADLLEHQEREWCPRFSLNLVVSKEDREVFRRLAPDADFLVVPNGVDTSAFRPSDSGTKNGSLVFVGGQAWFPNDDGMGYFANEILPLIRRTHPDIRTVWVGRASDKVKQEYAELGVEMTGYVEDIRPYVDPAACYIVPLRVGGGTRLKILDAWALGKAVVSTSRGCEGLDTRFGENILVADEPATFAAEVIRVLESADLRRRLGEGGRETAETTYDWEVIGESMLSAYRRILNPPPA